MNHYYDYQALDHLLTDCTDPGQVGNQLDQIMEALTVHASRDGGYHTELEEHYFTLRTLRDIFWKLTPIVNGDRRN